MYYNWFSKYGKILRILIFERTINWKAFIEFENQEQAEYAKKNLNNACVFEDGTKMNVFFANRTTI